VASFLPALPGAGEPEPADAHEEPWGCCVRQGADAEPVNEAGWAGEGPVEVVVEVQPGAEAFA
jgi:hypothetical protein